MNPEILFAIDGSFEKFLKANNAFEIGFRNFTLGKNGQREVSGAYFIESKDENVPPGGTLVTFKAARTNGATIELYMTAKTGFNAD